MPSSNAPAVRAERRILLHVLDVHGGALDRGAAEMGLAQPDPALAQRRQPLGAHAKGGFGNKDLLGLVEFIDGAFIGLRELRRAADDSREHGVEIERGIDRAQHFFERLQFGDRPGQLVGAGLQLAEQSRVLHRDDRLVGKGAHQFDLPLGERLDSLAGNDNDTDRLCFSQQRHAERGPNIADSDSLRPSVFRIGAEISDVDDSTLKRGARDHGPAARRE
jgi:hypothetical protein